MLCCQERRALKRRDQSQQASDALSRMYSELVDMNLRLQPFRSSDGTAVAAALDGSPTGHSRADSGHEHDTTGSGDVGDESLTTIDDSMVAPIAKPLPPLGRGQDMRLSGDVEDDGSGHGGVASAGAGTAVGMPTASPQRLQSAGGSSEPGCSPTCKGSGFWTQRTTSDSLSADSVSRVIADLNTATSAALDMFTQLRSCARASGGTAEGAANVDDTRVVQLRSALTSVIDKLTASGVCDCEEPPSARSAASRLGFGSTVESASSVLTQTGLRLAPERLVSTRVSVTGRGGVTTQSVVQLDLTSVMEELSSLVVGAVAAKLQGVSTSGVDAEPERQ